MDKILEIKELFDKIFNTNIYEELEKVKSIAQLVPWLAEKILILFDILRSHPWIIAIILGRIIATAVFVILYLRNKLR